MADVAGARAGDGAVAVEPAPEFSLNAPKLKEIFMRIALAAAFAAIANPAETVLSASPFTSDPLYDGIFSPSAWRWTALF